MGLKRLSWTLYCNLYRRDSHATYVKGTLDGFTKIEGNYNLPNGRVFFFFNFVKITQNWSMILIYWFTCFHVYNSQS